MEKITEKMVEKMVVYLTKEEVLIDIFSGSFFIKGIIKIVNLIAD